MKIIKKLKSLYSVVLNNQLSKTSLVMSKWCFTNYDAISIDFYWKIRNFSLFSMDKSIESSIFSTSNENEPKWKLIFEFPDLDTTKFFSIYLEIVDFKPKNIRTSSTFSIIKRNGFEYNRSFSSRYSDSKLREGIRNFITYDDSFKDEYLINDTLRITCNIKWTMQDFKSYVQDVPDIDFDEELSKDINSLYLDESLSDVSLEVEGMKFPVHKVILAARSSVFASMFKNDMKESEKRVIRIQGIKAEIMKVMISFMYTGQVDKIEENALELLKAADKYNLKGLKLLCENALCNLLNLDNVSEILHVADVYKAENLKKMAFNFIKFKSHKSDKNSKFRIH